MWRYCEVVEFGLAGRTMHSVDESVSVDELRKLSAIYERVLREYFLVTIKTDDHHGASPLALVGAGLRHSRRRLKRAMPTDARGRCPQKIKKVMVTMKVSSLSLSLSSLTTMKVSSLLLSLFPLMTMKVTTMKVPSLSLSLSSLTTMKVSSLSLFHVTVKVSSLSLSLSSLTTMKVSSLSLSLFPLTVKVSS